jgi:DNA replication protein DnaC
MTILSAQESLQRVHAALATRGIPIPDATAGPATHTGGPGEPGDPAWHHEQRVQLAVARWEAAVPPHYRRARTDHPAVAAWADAVIADARTAPSLLLWGGTGTGKTFHAFGATRRVAEAGPARFGLVFTTHPEMYADLRPKPTGEEERERFMRRLLTTPLLILDDLGTAKETEWTGEILYRVVNHRYNQELPTVITTNHEPGRLPALVGDRIASRLIQMTARVPMTGDDRRLSRGARRAR